ncbi:ATP-binding protein [Streptomyces sp. NPDC085932]|uniref:ATP-binding protein n=1 Tax=Streptomyces sp. NPDC085932 TaxID=3365741 RepID=UPI0037D98B72
MKTTACPTDAMEDSRSEASWHALPADATASGLARTFAIEQLSTWHLHGLADDLRLVVSELVSNAVTHGRPPVMMRIQHTPWSLALNTVRVEVIDTGRMPPAATTELLEAGPDDVLDAAHAVHPEREGGRGLFLIDQLATSWGITGCSSGTLVWCELTS